jgi:PRTRC genetic system ThiF family protein
VSANTLNIVKRIPLELGRVNNVNLVLVGCGGTGSFLALHLARLAWHAREQHGIEVALTLVDPDRVEAGNVGRQNFVPAEIGTFKAQSLAARYGLAFGLRIRFFNEALKPSHVDGNKRYLDDWLHLVVGAVDNNAARRDIESIVAGWSGRLWWLDCGNHDHSGQVLLGNADGLEISPLGFCTRLPLPSAQCPELVQDEVAPLVSCAEAALDDAQSLMVNQAAAGWAASFVYRMVVAQDLDVYATYFDLRAGSARSEYIVEAQE